MRWDRFWWKQGNILEKSSLKTSEKGDFIRFKLQNKQRPLSVHKQSFLYENHCECYKKLTSRLCIYTLLFFSHPYTLLFCWKVKSFCGCCCPQQNKNIKSLRIGFNITTTNTARSNPCNSCQHTANANVDLEANYWIAILHWQNLA